MEKMILADKTELEILLGASLGAITAVVNDFASLQTVADALTKEANLSEVQFNTNEMVTGEYKDMKLQSPLFCAVDVVDGKVHATFAIREKTEIEKEIDLIKAQQGVQDGAIMELAGMVGGES